MRIIETDCEVNYDGRGATSHGRGVRILIIKDDKSFLVHAKKGVKPMNYMTNVKEISEETDADDVKILTVTSKKGEVIDVVMYKTLVDVTLDVPDDTSDSMVNGTERQLQEWMSRDGTFQSLFGQHTVFVMRELKVDTGSIDLFGFDMETNKCIIIEVKRRAVKNDIYQLLRYRESIMKAAATMDHTISDQIDAASQLIPLNDVVRQNALKRVSFSTMADPELYLAAESGHGAVQEACESHGITYVECGSSWRGQTVDNSTASKTSLSSKSKRKDQDNMLI